MKLARHRIVCAGEAMVELSPRNAGWDVGHGGDTLNIALHLTRLGHDIAFFSALGADPFAGRMRADWSREGLDCSLLLSHPTRNTGLYAIETDSRGERHFHYWREHSAAREVFACPGAEQAQAAIARADLLVFSLISLAILPPAGRDKLLGLARAVRDHGGRVAFDGNYRARLWDSPQDARIWRDRAAAEADFGLPTLGDECALGGTTSEHEVAAHWAALGCGEVLVKLGERGCRLPDGGILPPESLFDPVDTSGAGDAFDAGYLSARLRDRPVEEAARMGQKLAGWTVLRNGAIPPRDHAAPYGAMVSGSPM